MKKLKEESKTRKYQETYSFTHKGIEVYIKIDYYNNRISLLDTGLAFYDQKPKKYVFAERGAEYMAGWLNILEAMSEAIKDAKRKYEHQLAETSKFTDKEFIIVKKQGS